MADEQKNRFTFIVSDESLNKYGTRVLTDGIETAEFGKNPVMFWNHKRDEVGFFGEQSEGDRLPIGRWENLRSEDGKLIADAVLDLGDELGREVARKVEQGFINAASIGIGVIELSDDPELMLKGQPRATITRSVLQEISLVDIPANENAMRLSMKGVSLTLKSGMDMSKLDKILPEVKLGENLASALSSAVDAFAGENEISAADAETQIAEASGVSMETIQGIKSGEQNCVSRETLEALASASGADLDAMIEAAIADGCEFEAVETDEEVEENSAPTVQEQVTNALNKFFTTLKTTFNLVPKEEAQVENPADTVADYFATLQADLKVVTVPVKETTEAAASTSDGFETLRKELQEMKEQQAESLKQVESLRSELIELKGQKSGGKPGAERKPLIEKTDKETESGLDAQFAAMGKQGIYQANKEN